jgi:hypothetical protein
VALLLLLELLVGAFRTDLLEELLLTVLLELLAGAFRTDLEDVLLLAVLLEVRWVGFATERCDLFVVLRTVRLLLFRDTGCRTVEVLLLTVVLRGVRFTTVLLFVALPFL